MGRKNKSGFGSGGPINEPYTDGVYYDSIAGNSAMGQDNGGAADQWVGGLTEDEYQAVRDYTGSDYDIINYNLRHDVWSSVTSPTADNIESAINKFQLNKTTVFHRESSARMLGGVDTVDGIRGMVGQVVMDKAFVSTTVVNEDIGMGVMRYHIKAGPGRGIGAYVNPVSHFKNVEYEFLFNRGSGFKITGAYKDPEGYVNVNMEYIGRM